MRLIFVAPASRYVPEAAQADAPVILSGKKGLAREFLLGAERPCVCWQWPVPVGQAATSDLASAKH